MSQKQWTTHEANQWYKKLPWLVGCNYIPSDAINQLEMWQGETFNRDDIIKKELAFAKSLGMNTVRVYLHDLLWEQDSEGFKQRIDKFLSIAAEHDIKPILVFFDSCWGENDPPKLGKQPEPRGTQNSGWVQSPSKEVLVDHSEYPRLEAYVKGVIETFKDDNRILAWDVWNEPDSSLVIGAFNDPRAEVAAERGAEAVEYLLPRVFEWAREAGATQPLTSGVCTTATKSGDWSSKDTLTPIEKIQIDSSDIISFHNYGDAEDFEKRVKWLKDYGRPVICTEFMARGTSSTFKEIYPIAHKYNIGILNWGLFNGKSQGHIAWGAKDGDHPHWFHDIVRWKIEPRLHEIGSHFGSRLHELESHLHFVEPHNIDEVLHIHKFIADVREKEAKAEEIVKRLGRGDQEGQIGLQL